MHRECYHSSNHFSLYLDNYKVISRNTPFTLQSNQQRMGAHTYLTGKRRHDCWKDFGWGILCVFLHAVLESVCTPPYCSTLELHIYFLPGWSRKTHFHIYKCMALSLGATYSTLMPATSHSPVNCSSALWKLKADHAIKASWRNTSGNYSPQAGSKSMKIRNRKETRHNPVSTLTLNRLINSECAE